METFVAGLLVSFLAALCLAFGLAARGGPSRGGCGGARRDGPCGGCDARSPERR